MSIWSKVFAGLVFVAAAVFFYFAAYTLKTHDAWHTSAKKLEDQVALAKAETKKVIEGDPEKGTPSLAQLKIDLHAAVNDRGRVWRNVAPGAIPANAPELTLTVTVEEALAGQIKPQMVLYAFDDRTLAEGGRYLGSFKVDAAAGAQVTLKTASPLPLSERQYAQLQAAAGSTWVLYETMPRDGHDVFDGLPEEQIKALLPAPPQTFPGEDPVAFQQRTKDYENLIAHYQASGKAPVDSLVPPPTAEQVMVTVKFVKNDKDAEEKLTSVLFPANIAADKLPSDETQKADVQFMLSSGQVFEFDKVISDQLIDDLKIAQEVSTRKYRRKLIDFATVLHEFERQLPVIQDRIASWDADRQYAENALADAKGVQLPYVEAEKTGLDAEKTRMLKERGLAVKRRKALAAQLAKLNKEISAALAENRKLAARLTELQFQAARNAEEASVSDQASAKR